MRIDLVGPARHLLHLSTFSYLVVLISLLLAVSSVLLLLPSIAALWLLYPFPHAK